MLQSIRDGLQSHKWLMYIVLGALALIFAAWGAYGIVGKVKAGAIPYAMAVDAAANLVYVANFSSDNATVIDGQSSNGWPRPPKFRGSECRSRRV